MKKLFYILLLLGSTYVFAQNKGMTYQAVIYAPGGQNVPGVNVANLPLANRTICLQFSLLDATSAIEYQEVVKIKTDEFGMVNITIGSGTQTGGYATSFAAVVWSASTDKSMKVALDATGLCNQYEELSVEKLDAVPFANAAITAGNVSGVVALANGGTGATTAAGARTNLGIGNVDNTSDLNKPMSTATKTYIDGQLTSSTIVDADTNTKGKIQLAGDLAGTAAAPTVPGLALKENAANKSTTTTLGTSNVLFPTQNAVKTYVDTAIAGATIVDADANTKGKIQLAGDLAGTAAAPTVPGLALKLDASLAGVPNGIATLNSAGIIPANQLPPISVASTNVVGSQAEMLALSAATVGSIAVRTDVNKNFILSTAGPSVLANWVELLTPGAPVQSVNGLTGAIQLSKADINLANVDNTSDAAKPVSTATQNALNLKLNTNQVGVANGTASLNALGKIPTDQIPAISFSSVKVLGSQAEMLAQTNALIGSVVIRTDVNKNYVLAQTDPTILANWLELLTPAPPVQSVNGYVGNVSLTKADLGLADVDNTGDINKPVSIATQNALDLKANLASPTFTGTVGGITKSMVGLANVDNTTDLNKPVSTPTQNALDLKANLASPTFSGTVSGITKAMVGLANVDNTTDAAKPVSTATQTALDLKANAADVTSSLALKANLASPTFTGTVSGITKAMVGLANVDNTTDAAKPVSTATQTALDLKANTVDLTAETTRATTTEATLTTNVATNATAIAAETTRATAAEATLTTNVATNATAIAAETTRATAAEATITTNVATNATAIAAETTRATAAEALKAPLASPTFTGTVSGIDKTMVGLGNVDNTTDAAKPVSTATQTALDLKANLASPTFTGTVSGIDKTMVGLGNVDNTSDASKPVSTATQTALDLKANLASPTFTGTVSGIDKTMVGLGNVDNTTDAAKPISTATQTALDLKENAANKTLSVTTDGASDVKFPSAKAVKTYADAKVVDGIADAETTSAPTQNAVFDALALKENAANKSTATNLGATSPSDDLFPTQKAVKTYVDAQTAAAGVSDGSITSAKILDGTIANIDVSSTAAIAYSKLNLASSIVVGDLADDAVETTKIKDVAVTEAKLAANAVTSSKIKDGEIATADIATAAITFAKIQNLAADKVLGRVSAGSGVIEEIATTGSGDVVRATSPTLVTPVIGAATGTSLSISGQLTSTIADGTAPFVVTSTTPVANLSIGGNAATVTTNANLTGDVTSSGNATTIGANKVVTGMIANANVTNAKLDKANIPLSGFGAAAADVALGANKLTGVADPTLAQDAATKNYVDTATAGITTLADGKIYLGNASNVATEVTPTGDVTMTNAGVTAIGTGKVVVGMLATDAVETIKIKDANVTAAKLATDAVETAKIKDAAVETAKIKDANVTYAKIQNVATGKVLGRVSANAGVVEEIATTGTGDVVRATSPTLVTPTLGVATATSVNGLTPTALATGFTIAGGSTTSKTLTVSGDATVSGTTSGTNTGDQTITLTGDVTGSGTGSFAATIGTGKVTTATIAADAVTSAKIADATIVVGDLAADAVETAKIKDANVTYAKIQNVATGKVLGRVSANAGVVEEIATTGTGDVVRVTSPTLVTPVLGAATATTINKVTITQPTASATLTIADGKTLTANNSIVLAGTDGKTMTFPATDATIARTDAAQTFTGTQTFSSDIVVNSVNIGLGNGAVATNTAVGKEAISGTATGAQNSALGYNALKSLTSGNYNTAIGSQASQNLSIGSENTALGYQALKVNMVGSSNTAIGKETLLALSDVTTNSNNTAVGTTSFKNLVTGSNSVALGKDAGSNSSTSAIVTSATNSIFVGADTKPLGATSTNEIVIGNGAVGLGNNSTVVGNATITQAKVFGALDLPNTTGSTSTTTGALKVAGGAGIAGNTFIGGTISIAGGAPAAGKVLTSDANGLGSWTAIPAINLTSGVSGILPVANGGTGSATQNFVDLTTDQTIAGIKALSSDIVVNSVNIGRGKGAVASNTAVGTDAISATATGTDNAALGYNALKVVTSGNRNTAVGSLAATSLTTGNDNTVLGYQALKNNTTGASNVAIGKDALLANSTGNNNIAIGTSSLLGNTTGFSNIAMGLDSALSNTTGNDNLAIGQSALRLNTTGLANTAIGRSALSATTTGNYNSALGWQSLAGNTTGIDNVAVGYNAGRYDTTGTTEMTTSSFSVYLGSSTKGLNATGSVNETVIGNAAVGLGSNSTVIGNSSTTKAAIYGALDLPNATESSSSTTGALKVAGGVGIAKSLTIGSTTASSSTATGALKVAGGAGIAGAIYAGSIQNTPIGSTTASTGAFTTLAASGNTTVGGTLAVTGATTLSSTLDVTGNTVVSGTLKVAGGTPGAGKVLTSDANGLASWSNGVGSAVTTTTAAYAITLAESIVFYTGSAAGTFSIPAAASTNTGKEIIIKNKTGFGITVTPASGTIYIDNANAAAASVSLGIEASNNWIKLVSDGTQWNVLRALF